MVAGERGVTFRDFQPVNTWIEDNDSGEVFDDGSVMYIIDQSTSRIYLNSSGRGIRFNCVIFATLGTPVVHTLSMFFHTAYRMAKLVTGAHFWIPREENKRGSLKERGLEAVEDLLKVISAPLLLLCVLEAAAIYGLFNPRDGRKLYASLERLAFYETFFLAPCFQPSPTHHLLRGDLRVRDAF